MFLYIPPELADQEDDIKRFFCAMIYKLRKNAHKGHWPDMDVKSTLKRMKDELAELEQAIEEQNEVEILLESADVANFALILANIAITRKGATDGNNI